VSTATINPSSGAVVREFANVKTVRGSAGGEF
jgi:hypothetical protein